MFLKPLCYYSGMLNSKAFISKFHTFLYHMLYYILVYELLQNFKEKSRGAIGVWFALKYGFQQWY